MQFQVATHAHSHAALSVSGMATTAVLPRSPALWVSAGYIALFIIRPWEELMPWLESFRIERTYGIFMLVTIALTRGFRFPLTFQTFSVAAFTAALGLSALCAWDPAVEWDWYYAFLVQCVCFIAILSVVRTPYELLFIVASYVAITGLYLGKSEWEYFLHGQHTYDQGVARLVGIDRTYRGPNSVALTTVACLPFWHLLWAYKYDYSENWPVRIARAWRWSLAGCLLVMVLAIFLTVSRTGMFCLGLFVVLTYLRFGSIVQFAKRAIAVALILAAAWCVVPDVQRNRFRTLWDPSSGPANAEASAQGRVDGFWAGVEAFRRSPLTGVGAGSFKQYRMLYIDGSNLATHNLVGELLGCTGICGTAALATVILAIFAGRSSCRRLSRQAGDRTGEFLGAVAKAGGDSVILLFVGGLGAHCMVRYNWLWISAFTALALRLLRQHVSSAPRYDDIDEHWNGDSCTPEFLYSTPR